MNWQWVQGLSLALEKNNARACWAPPSENSGAPWGTVQEINPAPGMSSFSPAGGALLGPLGLYPGPTQTPTSGHTWCEWEAWTKRWGEQENSSCGVKETVEADRIKIIWKWHKDTLRSNSHMALTILPWQCWPTRAGPGGHWNAPRESLRPAVIQLQPSHTGSPSAPAGSTFGFHWERHNPLLGKEVPSSEPRL